MAENCLTSHETCQAEIVNIFCWLSIVISDHSKLSVTLMHFNGQITNCAIVNARNVKKILPFENRRAICSYR